MPVTVVLAVWLRKVLNRLVVVNWRWRTAGWDADNFPIFVLVAYLREPVALQVSLLLAGSRPLSDWSVTVQVFRRLVGSCTGLPPIGR